jgi:hypothetical protein
LCPGPLLCRHVAVCAVAGTGAALLLVLLLVLLVKMTADSLLLVLHVLPFDHLLICALPTLMGLPLALWFFKSNLKLVEPDCSRRRAASSTLCSLVN